MLNHCKEILVDKVSERAKELVQEMNMAAWDAEWDKFDELKAQYDSEIQGEEVVD